MEYYIYDENGKRIGPIQGSDLKNYDITSDTLIWREGLNDWVTLSELPELKSLKSKVPPPLEDKSKTGCGGEIALMILCIIGAIYIPFL